MIGRRTFLAGSAAALAVVAAPGGAQVVVEAAEQRAEEASYGRLATWLRVAQDGFVDVYTDKVEVGMGVLTGFAQIVAEELDVPLARIRLHSGDTADTANQGGVGGSTSTERGATAFRNAAAEARRVLVNAAAIQLGVPATALAVRDGVVRDPASGRGVAYGKLVAALAAAPVLADQTATVSVSKLKDLNIRMYGFVETDVIADTTQGFTEEMDSTLVARSNTYAGQNHRTQMSVRNSRLGFDLTMPKMDFS